MRVRWTPQAAHDLQAASDYVFSDRPDISRRIAWAVNTSAKSLKTFLLRGRLGSLAGTRELFVDQYPYVIVYEVSNEAVLILNVTTRLNTGFRVCRVTIGIVQETSSEYNRTSAVICSTRCGNSSRC